MRLRLTDRIHLDTVLRDEHDGAIVCLRRMAAGTKRHIAKAAILRRSASAELGNFGDCQPVGEGVSEMRIHHGAGYRAYFLRNGNTVFILLCGGSKASQKRDIKVAKQLAQELKASTS
jgi:putative addiction module killer protein